VPDQSQRDHVTFMAGKGTIMSETTCSETDELETTTRLSAVTLTPERSANSMSGAYARLMW
jgi:hypothetical protein